MNDGKLHKQEIHTDDRLKGRLLFALKVTDVSEGAVYAGKLLKPSEVPEIGIQKAGCSFMFLHISSGVILLILIGILFWLLTTVGQPIEHLGKWAKNLSAKNINAPKPDFRYKS